MATEAIAPAKINLCLHLTGLRHDGYHLLESLVVFTEFGDELRVTAADSLSLSVDGPFAAGVPTDDRNLVLRAAKFLQAKHGIDAGARIALEKNLPHGGGIGGGSSDAAAALKLLSDLWGIPLPDSSAAAQLGADVPVCLYAPQPLVMRGIGEDITPVALPKFWLVIVNAGAHVDTGQAFAVHDKLYDASAGGIEPLPAGMDLGAFESWLLSHRNDFTKAIDAGGLAPVVSDILGALWSDPSCRVAEMSGSGSTCWGLFASKADAASCADRLRNAHPTWWVRVSEIR